MFSTLMNINTVCQGSAGGEIFAGAGGQKYAGGLAGGENYCFFQIFCLFYYIIEASDTLVMCSLGGFTIPTP